MREEKKYLDEEWGGLPLPDQEKAWQKMQQLLDEDNKRRPLLPVWLQRYGGFALLLIGLGVAGSYWFTSDTDSIRTSTSTNKRSQPNDRNSSSTVRSEKQQPITLSEPHGTTDHEPASNTVISSLPKNSGNDTRTKSSSVKTIKSQAAKLTTSRSEKEFVDGSGNLSDTSQTNSGASSDRSRQIEAIAPVLPVIQQPIELKDSAARRASLPIASRAEQKAGKQNNSELAFSAGVGLQRAIAFNGQESTDYTYHGTRNVIADLIPSVYFRLQKQDWFVQAEFQYAVPQPVKQVTFSQKTVYSPANQNLNTEQFSIQKLYYHHLPFSINYYVLPAWSVGTGAMYSILAGAVTEQEITSKNVQTGTESVTRNLAPIKGYKDSFLYKSTTGVMLQTDYQWKRFSVGLRFIQNLQPFIKYTAPNGEVLDEKNKTLQAILRFRLF